MNTLQGNSLPLFEEDSAATIITNPNDFNDCFTNLLILITLQNFCLLDTTPITTRSLPSFCVNLPQLSYRHSLCRFQQVSRFDTRSKIHRSTDLHVQVQPPFDTSVMVVPEISKHYVPLTCHGHSRPVTHLNFSDITSDGQYYMISACKGRSMCTPRMPGDAVLMMCRQ